VANTDDDNLSELLDDEKFDGMQVPPDRPLGMTDRGVDRDEDSVAERKRREIPDRSPRSHADDVGPLVDPTAESGYDDEPDAVATEVHTDRDRRGLDMSVQDLEEVQPAEEAAMHITEDPPFDDDDGYVSD
jgi:hypothetical protein